jgi:hypothetical protein
MVSMRAARRIVMVAAAALVLAPAAAQAKPKAEPLVDVAPLGTHFKDRVISSAKTTARAAATADFHAYPTKDGKSVAVAISDGYAGQISQTVAQSYVDFLDSLAHGPELARLRIIIAPPSEVLAGCGRADGTLACYDSGTFIMLVPGEQMQTTSGVTTSYVVAHEYGHHIAANRLNTPFNAFRFGPKYWASYERVCDRSARGLLAPGNEDRFYTSNPGEAWAETYAQLKYPEISWQYTPLLKPDKGAFEAAMRDVSTPWAKQVSEVFKGKFRKRGSNVKRFNFTLTLDGALDLRLRGPRKANYDLVITSNGRSQGRTRRSGTRDIASYQAACRENDSEHVTVAVKRTRGSGPFRLRLRYAG